MTPDREIIREYREVLRKALNVATTTGNTQFVIMACSHVGPYKIDFGSPPEHSIVSIHSNGNIYIRKGEHPCVSIRLLRDAISQLQSLRG